MAIQPSRLFQILQNTRLQQTDNPLYQLLRQMLLSMQDLSGSSSSSSGGGGGGSTVVNNYTTVQQIGLGDDSSGGDDNYYLIGSQSSNEPDQDYVVMSDGATPTPSPVDDGFGNFIYVAYTP